MLVVRSLFALSSSHVGSSGSESSLSPTRTRESPTTRTRVSVGRHGRDKMPFSDGCTTVSKIETGPYTHSF